MSSNRRSLRAFLAVVVSLTVLAGTQLSSVQAQERRITAHLGEHLERREPCGQPGQDTLTKSLRSMAAPTPGAGDCLITCWSAVTETERPTAEPSRLP
jgi:hypothetical protein